ncbi:MAG: Cna B-type domain-containing protein, partial [Enterococcus sp.]
MKKFFRGKLSAKLALVAILANTLTSPVGVIAEEVTTDSSQEPKVGLNESSQTLESGTLESSLEKVEEQPKIELQEFDTDGKDILEADESFTANLKGTFSNLQESSEKVITFKLNSDFVLDDEIKAPSEDIQVIKLSDDSFKVDFSQVEEAAKEFELTLPLSVKSTAEEAKLVLSSDHTQDVSKTFKVSQAAIKTQQSTSGQSSDEVDNESETLNSSNVDITEESKATETEKESKVETEKTKTTEKKEQSIVSKQAKSAETISVSGKITWEDGNDKYGWRPGEVKVFLYDRTQYKNVQEVTISPNEFGVWEFSFPEAPKLNPSGNLADYIISSNLDNKYQFTRENDNSYDYKASIKKSFSPMIRLLWLDNDNSQGKRPDSEEYHLLQNGKVCGTVTPNGQGSVWTANFERMPIFDDNFVPYKYEVQKKETTGYTTTYDYSNFNYDPTSDIETDTGILGIHIRKYIGSVQEFTTLSGTFTWDDANDKNGERPGKVHAKIYQNGELMDSVGISLPVDKNSNQGTYLVENLPKFDAKGNLYKYTLEVPGGVDFPYSQKVNGNNFEFSLYRSRRISTSKGWDDNDNEKNIRPQSIEIELYRIEDGKEIFIERQTVVERYGQWNGEFDYVPEFDENYNKYTYIVKEKVPTGYSCEIDYSRITWSSKNNPTIYLMNRLKEETPVGSVKITKVDSAVASTKLSGATFKITNVDTKEVWLAESNPTASNGELTITDIPVGKYELEEVKA